MAETSYFQIASAIIDKLAITHGQTLSRL